MFGGSLERQNRTRSLLSRRSANEKQESSSGLQQAHQMQVERRNNYKFIKYWLNHNFQHLEIARKGEQSRKISGQKQTRARPS